MLWTIAEFTGKYKRPIFVLGKNERYRADEFLKGCRNENKDCFNTLTRLIQRLADCHEMRNSTQFKQVRKNLFELKVQNYRLYLFFDDERIILVDGGKKGAEKSQTRDIDNAQRAKDEYFREKS